MTEDQQIMKWVKAQKKLHGPMTLQNYLFSATVSALVFLILKFWVFSDQPIRLALVVSSGSTLIVFLIMLGLIDMWRAVGLSKKLGEPIQHISYVVSIILGVASNLIFFSWIRTVSSEIVGEIIASRLAFLGSFFIAIGVFLLALMFSLVKSLLIAYRRTL